MAHHLHHTLTPPQLVASYPSTYASPYLLEYLVTKTRSTPYWYADADAATGETRIMLCQEGLVQHDLLMPVFLHGHSLQRVTQWAHLLAPCILLIQGARV
ncbi:hypothetical protein IF1G_03700 [Cordyceps javanica]|uniref:Uncharacterized protein n=1 Tax=Cordyceps javanica TaxID=43265 RepID=A0A545V899_9HYPO|nr:hypothetical protein IF1G_03700 [Cordyceps javanica]